MKKVPKKKIQKKTNPKKKPSKYGDETVPRIFYLSNGFNLNTGYASCVRHICNRIGEKFWVTHISENQSGSPFKPEGFNFDVLPFFDNDSCLLQAYIDRFKPAVIIIQEDSFTCFKKGIHDIDFGDSILVGYFPHDGEVMGNISKKVVDKCDYIVAMTEFGKKKFEEEGYENVSFIYHGTDEEVFKPLTEPEKQTKRKDIQSFLGKISGKEPDLENKFLAYTCGRNTLRKQYFNLLRAWCLFAKDKDDVSLLVNSIHYNAIDNNMKDWVKRTIPFLDGTDGKEIDNNKIIFFPSQTYNRGVPVGFVSDMTACSDITFYSALGEGFGMCISESIFCEVPVVSHSYTTPKYLVGKNRGILFGSSDWFVGGWGIPHKLPDVNDAVRALEDAYKLWNEGKLSQKFKKGFKEFKEKYTWDKVSQQWIDFIEEITND